VVLLGSFVSMQAPSLRRGSQLWHGYHSHRQFCGSALLLGPRKTVRQWQRRERSMKRSRS
jgi:hypothetical protein